MSNTDTLLSKVEGVRADMKEHLFRQWCTAKTVEEREEIHATFRGIAKLTSLLNKSIKETEHV